MTEELTMSGSEANRAQAGLGPGRAAVLGILGFGVPSLVVYGTVAFAGRWLYRNLTEPGAYAFWAALYLLGAPWLLGRLLVAPARRRWFLGWFVLGFVAYALGWVAAYFPLRGKTGELIASGLGPALFALVLCRAYRRPGAWPSLGLVLGIGHTLGYFAGDWVNTAAGGPGGMVGWGACHGAGYGAALGWAIAKLEGGRTMDVPGGAGRIEPCPVLNRRRPGTGPGRPVRPGWPGELRGSRPTASNGSTSSPIPMPISIPAKNRRGAPSSCAMRRSASSAATTARTSRSGSA
jgi:hypothetical protein